MTITIDSPAGRCLEVSQMAGLKLTTSAGTFELVSSRAGTSISCPGNTTRSTSDDLMACIGDENGWYYNYPTLAWGLSTTGPSYADVSLGGLNGGRVLFTCSR